MANEYEGMRDSFGWHDTIEYITKTCALHAFSKLEDQHGRSVQAVFATILSEQLKVWRQCRFCTMSKKQPFVESLSCETSRLLMPARQWGKCTGGNTTKQT